MRLKCILLPLLCLVLAFPGFAQVQVFLHQPPPGQLNIADLWKFEVLNSTEVTRYIKFYATVSREDGLPIFEGTSSVYELSGMFSGVISFPELEPFDMSHVDEEIKEILLRTGTVPSGVYIICLEIIDAESMESVYRDCIDQEVIQASPPVLVYPVDGAALEEEMPVFSWIEPVPPVDGMQYKIRISEILADQSPEQALLSTPPFFEYEGVMGNLFEYPLSARPLEIGRNYAWRVTGTILGHDLLESEYATFIRLDPSGAAAEIELTFPPDGELIDPLKSVFCWKSLPGDDIVYNVIVAKSDCDTTLSGDESHPFGYLGDNPDIRRADSLRRAIENYEIPFWRAFCETLRENTEAAERNRGIFSEQQRQFEEWAREIGCELTEPDCELPDCCPQGDCCADLDPSDPTDRAELRRRLECLTGAMRSMNSEINELAEGFESLIDFWRNGAGHRETMGGWNDIFSAFEYLFSMEWLGDLQNEIFDALGINQLMDEIRDFVLNQICSGMQYTDEECQAFIEKLNDLEQLLNDVKDGKEDIDTFRDAMNAIRTGGDLPIEVFLKLMENLHAAAGEATGTAVEGWDKIWREMCDALQQSYHLNRCIQELNEKIAGLADDCQELCDEITSALDSEAREAGQEYERLREEMRERWRQDSTQFTNDLDEAIKEIADELGSNRLCCPDGSGRIVYTFPPYGSDDPCKEYIYGLLGNRLGNRLCYFNIRIEIDCETLEVNYTWETTEGFRRNENCCPRVSEEETIGRTESNPGEDEVCWPPGGDENDPGREGIDTGGEARWRVEAERDGRVIGRSSSRRYRTRPGYADPQDQDTIRIPRTPPAGGCDCRVNLSINGFAMPAGLGMIIDEGTSLNIKMDGGCSGTCVSAGQDLSIQLPVLNFLGMHWVNPVFKAAGRQANYKFNDTGTYRVVARQICSDGSWCEATAVIEVKRKSKASRKSGVDAVKHSSAAKCGNSPCMHPYYFLNQDKLLISGNEISFESPGDYKLGYLSECFPQCSADKEIRWEVTGPDGKMEVKNGRNLFEISYGFNSKGIYNICIIETASCANGNRQDSKYLIVEIE